MDKKLFAQALIKFFMGVVVTGVLLFASAGTLCYRNGWIFMGILFIPMFFAGIVLMIKNPDLLRRRLHAREQVSEQKTIIACGGME